MEATPLYVSLVDPANWVGLDKSVDLLDYLRVSSHNRCKPDGFITLGFRLGPTCTQQGRMDDFPKCRLFNLAGGDW